MSHSSCYNNESSNRCVALQWLIIQLPLAKYFHASKLNFSRASRMWHWAWTRDWPWRHFGVCVHKMADPSREEEQVTLLGEEGLMAGGQALKLGYAHIDYNGS